MIQEFRIINWLLNCWLGVWGMFQGYVAKFLDLSVDFGEDDIILMKGRAGGVWYNRTKATEV